MVYETPGQKKQARRVTPGLRYRDYLLTFSRLCRRVSQKRFRDERLDRGRYDVVVVINQILWQFCNVTPHTIGRLPLDGTQIHKADGMSPWLEVAILYAKLMPVDNPCRLELVSTQPLHDVSNRLPRTEERPREENARPPHGDRGVLRPRSEDRTKSLSLTPLRALLFAG